MSMTDLQMAYRLIAQHPDLAEFGGPRTGALIHSAETALGLRFPPTYRDFLSRLASGGFGSDEFYGLEDDQFEDAHGVDAVARTLFERANSKFPHDLIAIYEPGDGTLFALDSSKPDGNGEYPVVEWDGPGSDLVHISEDFGAFLLMIVKEVLVDEGRS